MISGSVSVEKTRARRIERNTKKQKSTSCPCKYDSVI